MIAGYTLGVALDYGVATSLLLGSLWAAHTLLTYPISGMRGWRPTPP